MTKEKTGIDSRPPSAVACKDGLCHFADLKDNTWFYLPLDPNKKPYFKCNNRSPIGRDYKSFLLKPETLVLSAVA